MLIAFLTLSVAAGAWAMPEVRAFAVPTGAAREMTGPFFWLHGTESEARLREYVGRVDESGQGILTAESRPHIDWMGPTWWRDLRIVIDEAKRSSAIPKQANSSPKRAPMPGCANTRRAGNSSKGIGRRWA